MIKETKPILIVKIPSKIALKDSEVSKSIGSAFMSIKEDYHVLIVNSDVNEWDFKGVWPKDFEPIDLESLKEELKAILI